MSYQLFEYEGKWVSFEQLTALKKAEVEKRVVPEVSEIVKKPFCDSCDSKGVRHKKECPKNNPNE